MFLLVGIEHLRRASCIYFVGGQPVAFAQFQAAAVAFEAIIDQAAFNQFEFPPAFWNSGNSTTTFTYEITSPTFE